MADSHVKDLVDTVQNINDCISKTTEELNRVDAQIQQLQVEQKDDTANDTFATNTELINNQDMLDFAKQIEANFDMTQIRGLFHNNNNNNTQQMSDHNDDSKQQNLENNINYNENDDQESDIDIAQLQKDMQSFFTTKNDNINNQNEDYDIESQNINDNIDSKKAENELDEIEVLQELEFAEKSKIKFIELPTRKCTLNYQIINENNLNDNNKYYPLLFIHGLCDSLLTYSLLLPKLMSYENAIISVSLKGFGDSKVDCDIKTVTFSITEYLNDLIELLNKLNISKAIWIGHSFGTFIVEKAAIETPEFVQKIVLISPNYKCDIGQYEKWNFVADNEKCKNDKQCVEKMKIEAAKCDVYVLKKTFESMMSFNSLNYLKYIKCPCYILIGEDDKIFDKQYAYTIHKYIKSSFIMQFPNCNHYLIWNKAIISRLAMIIWDFCRQ